ncbi:hypothetical protein AKO1_008084 [Acrasis kona]|uniref:Uncharacterized protein n=1 Tax=Acrasis kona TaxID=1008807 RepID=A0AAW2YPZ6_9EUKA
MGTETTNYLRAERDSLTFKLSNAEERLQTVQKQYQELLASRWVMAGEKKDADDMLINLVNEKKVHEEQLLNLRSTIEQDALEKLKLRQEIQLLTEREQQKTSLQVTSPTPSTTQEENITTSQLQNMITLNKQLQQELISLQNRLDQSRIEKKQMGQIISDRLKNIDESISAQIKSQHDANTILIRSNHQLRDQLVESNRAVLISEEKMLNLINQQMKDSAAMSQQSLLLEVIAKKEEDAKVELLHALYENERFKSQLDSLRREMNKEIEIYKSALKAKSDELNHLKSKKPIRYATQTDATCQLTVKVPSEETITSPSSEGSITPSHSSSSSIITSPNNDNDKKQLHKSLGFFNGGRTKRLGTLPQPPTGGRQSVDHGIVASGGSNSTPTTPESVTVSKSGDVASHPVSSTSPSIIPVHKPFGSLYNLKSNNRSSEKITSSERGRSQTHFVAPLQQLKNNVTQITSPSSTQHLQLLMEEMKQVKEKKSQSASPNVSNEK